MFYRIALLPFGEDSSFLFSIVESFVPNNAFFYYISLLCFIELHCYLSERIQLFFFPLLSTLFRTMHSFNLSHSNVFYRIKLHLFSVFASFFRLESNLFEREIFLKIYPYRILSIFPLSKRTCLPIFCGIDTEPLKNFISGEKIDENRKIDAFLSNRFEK